MNRKISSKARRVPMLCYLGHNDRDIIPHFVRWYRRLGVSEFHFILHGPWKQGEVSDLEAIKGVNLAGLWSDPFSETEKCSRLTSLARTFPDQWIVTVDADEFLELPHDTVQETIAELEKLAIDEMYCLLVQRIAADGKLNALVNDPWHEFPLADITLPEQMGCNPPTWKSKYPLAKVTARYDIGRGFHLPANGRPVAHFPIRGIVHHFKWRRALELSLADFRGKETNHGEQRTYARYLAENGRLPVANAFRYTRDIGIRDALLVRPKRGEITAARALNTAMSGRRRRVALVAFEVSGISKCGGIGTSTGALAMLLSASGFDVHIFYCPFEGPANMPPLWQEYWNSFGINLSYVPRHDRSFSDHSFNLVAAVHMQGDFDIIHFHECCGYAGFFCALKKAGVQFTGSRIVISTHGGTQWANEVNATRWLAEEQQFEHWSLENCDFVLSPSQYMLDWYRARGVRMKKNRVIPNILPPELKTFGRIPRRRRQPSSIAFFGRIEDRKGIDTFLEALPLLRDREVALDAVHVLGRYGSLYDHDTVMRSRESHGYNLIIQTSFDSLDAARFMNATNSLAVIPSRRENSPYAVYECGEQAIPLLTTLTGGTPELIGSDTALIEIDNDPQNLAERIATAFKSGIEPIELAADGSHAEAATLELFVSLAKSRRRAPQTEKPPQQMLEDINESARAYPEVANAFRKDLRNAVKVGDPGTATWMRGALLSASPLVTFSFCSWDMPFALFSARPDLASRANALHFVKHVESVIERRNKIGWTLNMLASMAPGAEFVLLVNNAAELATTRKLGYKALLCPSSALVEEWRVMEAPSPIRKRFGAIYYGDIEEDQVTLLPELSRPIGVVTRTPRQDLLERVGRMGGGRLELLNQRQGVVFEPSIGELGAFMQSAPCGITIGRHQDVEKMLLLSCGVPVVSVGDTEDSNHFDLPDLVCHVKRDPAAVRESIQYLTDSGADPETVRTRIGAVLKFERRRIVSEMMDTVRDQFGETFPLRVDQLFGTAYRWRTVQEIFCDV